MKKLTILFLVLLSALTLNAQNWDINTLHTINKQNNKFIRNYSKTISNTTAYIAAGVPLGMAAYASLNHDKKLLADAIYIGTAVGEAASLTYVMKHLVPRERPYERYPDKIIPRALPDSPSFPSAHTAAAFSLATSLSIKYPKWYIIAPSSLWACSVGYSRMNQGVHYPSDVMAGALIGTGCAVLNIYINRLLTKALL